MFLGSYSRICHIDNEEITKKKPVFRATGDIGIQNSNRIIYKGRKNSIIKRFGHKINLIEIEEIMNRELELSCKCVWYQRKRKLLLFIVLHEQEMSRKVKIIDKLRVKIMHTVPKESFPDFIDVIPKLPLTCHGKIDTRHLIKHYEQSCLASTSKKFSDQLSCLFCKYLGINFDHLEVFKEYSFFELGGNSITATQLLDECGNIADLDQRELVAFLFQSSISSCIEFAKTIDRSDGYSISQEAEEVNNTQYKRRKYDNQLDVRWKYDLKACVDCSPIIFAHRYIYYEIITLLLIMINKIFSEGKNMWQLEVFHIYFP